MLTSILSFFSAVLFVGSGLGAAYLIASTFGVFRFSNLVTSHPVQKPPVTILKPLCGNEHDLKENLRSFCIQDYPSYQIVFGVQNPEDESLKLVQELKSEFPSIDMDVVIDSTQLSTNMKVANLQNMLSSAKHSILVIADSDMRVNRNYLKDVTAPLVDFSVGAVTCLYRSISDGRFWSDFGCMHINYGFLAEAMLGDWLTIGNGCFGATIAMRRDMLESIGGFSKIGHVLADDHELGLLVRQMGKKVTLSPHLLDTIISEPSVVSLFAHETRWARTIHMVHPKGYCGSLFTHPVALGFIGTLCSSQPHIGLCMLACVVTLRFVTAWLINQKLGFSSRLMWLLPVRDMVSFVVFLNGFFYGTVKWRSHRFRVERNGKIMLDGDFVA